MKIKWKNIPYLRIVLTIFFTALLAFWLYLIKSGVWIIGLFMFDSPNIPFWLAPLVSLLYLLFFSFPLSYILFLAFYKKLGVLKIILMVHMIMVGILCTVIYWTIIPKNLEFFCNDGKYAKIELRPGDDVSRATEFDLIDKLKGTKNHIYLPYEYEYSDLSCLKTDLDTYFSSCKSKDGLTMADVEKRVVDGMSDLYNSDYKKFFIQRDCEDIYQ